MAYLAGSNFFTNYQHQADTSAVAEKIGTTIEYYPYTGFTYTPVSGASNVIIECDIQSGHSPDAKGNLQNVRVQYSTNSTNYINGSWTNITGTQCQEGNNSNMSSPSYDQMWHQSQYFFIIPAWTGERKIRIAARSGNSSTEYSINDSYNTLNASSSGAGSCPIVSIYSEISS